MEKKLIKKGTSVLLSLNMLMGGMISDSSLLTVRAETVEENLIDSENKSVTDTVPVLSSTETRDLSGGEQKEMYRVGIIAGEEISLRQILIESGFLRDSDVDAYLDSIESVEVSDVDVFTLVEDRDDYTFIAEDHFDSEQTITLETKKTVSYITVTDRSKTPVRAVVTENGKTGSVAVTASGGERFSDWVNVYADFNLNDAAVNAVTQNNVLYAEYCGFSVNTDESIGSGYDVSVVFPETVKGEGYRLFYVSGNYVEEIYGNIETTGDPNSPVAAGIKFHTNTLGNFVLACTKTYNYWISQDAFVYHLTSDDAVPLKEVLIQSGMVKEEEADLFLQNVQGVTSDNPDVLKVDLTEDYECVIHPLIYFIEQSLTVVMADGQTGIITVRDDRGGGITEAVSYPDNIEIESITISPTEDKLLPEDAESTAEVVEGTESIEAVSEEAEENTPAEAVTEYKVFDIDLENVEKQEYDGFDVEMKLSKEAAVTGGDFKLYHILDDGTYEEVPVTVNMTTDEFGNEVVDTIAFTTPSFSEFVLVYTITAYYREVNGDTWKISAEYSADAGIPSNAQLSVTEIKEGDEGYEGYVTKSADALGKETEDISFAKAFDITLVNPETGEVYQPAENKDVKITIELLDNSLEGITNVDIVHIHGEPEEQAEVLGSTLAGDAVQFNTKGFSVFVVTGANAVPRRTYTFFVPNEAAEGYTEYHFTDADGKDITKQYVKNGELPVIPSLESTAVNEFDGWYKGTINGSELVIEDTPFDFSSSFTADEPVNLYPKFKEYIYVNFHDQYDKDAGIFPITKTKRAELINGSATVQIDDVSTVYSGSQSGKLAFYGWSYEQVKNPGDTGVVISGSTITVDKTTDLYPIYAGIHWLSYYSAKAGSGATYFPSHYYFAEEGPTKLQVPELEGYQFTGWWTGKIITPEGSTEETIDYGKQVSNADGTLIDTLNEPSVYFSGGKLLLRADTTLYARWEAKTTANYQIIVWKQEANSSYWYAESDILPGTIGNTVEVPNSYKGKSYTGYTYSHCDEGKKVLSDGSTVLNVYYNRNSLNPATGTFKLRFEDSITASSQNLPIEKTGLSYGADLTKKIPADPKSSRTGYEFDGWYMDSGCTVKANLSTMPDHDLTVYAGWKKEWYLIQIDPNYGSLNGNGSTWFWEQYGGDPIQEYTHVTRDYEQSSSGNYYFVKHDRAYYGYSGKEWDKSEKDRDTHYTVNPGEATEDTTFESAPGIYSYEAWYEVNPDGSETLYNFDSKVTHDTILKMHWKKAGCYYFAYSWTDPQGQSHEGLPQGPYSDNASIIITKSVDAPEGYTFAGWKIRGQEAGTIYRTGQSFTLHSDDAIRISGKEVVYLEAVFVKVGLATIIYDANGGTISENPDFGKFPGAVEPVSASGTIDGTTATVTGIVNNSDFILSTGAGFSKTGTTFAGWSNKTVYEQNKQGVNLYAGGQTYGVDKNEPIKLYAVWAVNVTYHLNSDNADWGTPWDPTIYTYDENAKTYTQTLYIGNTVSEPVAIPQYTGTDGKLFRYWKTTTTGTTQYDFSQPLTGSIDLYCHWSEPESVKVHAVDTSSETIVSKDDAWLKTNAAIQAGITETSINADSVKSVFKDTIIPEGSSAPTGYVFGFAAVHDSTNLQKISDERAITSIWYNQSEKKTYVKYADNTTGALKTGEEIYLVYYQLKNLPIKYRNMLTSGELVIAPVTEAPDHSGSLGSCNLGAVITSPKTWAGKTSGYYAYAIGDKTAGNASQLHFISDTSDSDTSHPDVQIRNTWRGLQYSTNEGTTWIDCGYDPAIYTVYFEQRPTVVLFSELTSGTESSLETVFDYELVVEQTETTTASVQKQIKNGETWSNYGEPTSRDPKTETTSVFTGTYHLKNGESQSAILFYKTETRAPEEGASYSEDGNTYRDVTTKTVVTSQTAIVTQTEKSGYVTEIDTEYGTTTDNHIWTCPSDSAGGTKTATFKNTLNTVSIEVQVAIVDPTGIIRKNAFRKIPYKFDLPIGETKDFQTALDPDKMFDGSLEIYAFGTVLYGTDDGEEGHPITAKSMDVKSVSYQKGADDIYRVTLEDSNGTVLDELDNYNVYYLYYPMPEIRYVKLVSSSDPESGMENISGSYDEYNPSPEITYNHDSVIINNVTVKQDQTVKIPKNGLLISQTGGLNSFRMPPLLDDGIYARYLKYTKIGAGKYDADSLDDISSNSSCEMRLRINNNALQYSFNDTDWFDLNLSEIPTIYAIYEEKGYDLQISKTVDTSDSGRDPIFIDRTFVVTLTSNSITKAEYSAEGYETETISATPAVGSEPGTIVLEHVKDGTKIKIKGLGKGDYEIVETNNENFVLTAMAGPIVGGSTSPIDVFNNNTINLSLNEETELDLKNRPQDLCKIVDNDEEHIFYRFSDAIKYVDENIPTNTATIEMLADYLMPEEDVLTIPSHLNITLTTALTGEHQYSGSERAVIKRNQDHKTQPMIINSGTFTTTEIKIEGDDRTDVTAPAVQSSGDLTLSVGTFIQNTHNSHIGENPGNGGAINATAGNVTFDAATITNSEAVNGGVLYYSGSGTITFKGSSKISSNNRATKGGAVYVTGGTIVVQGNSQLMSNRAKEGGAIYAENGVISVEQNAKITGNTASQNGGAIYTRTGTVSITSSNGKISDNTAAQNGGGIYSESGTVNISNGTMSGNKATDGAGGSIYTNTGTVNVSGGSISASEASNGAALFVDSTGKAYISGGTISGNISGADGGAIGVGSTSTRLYFSANAIVKDNKVNNEQHNVCLNQDSDMVINTSGLNAEAEVGIYVPGNYEDDLYKHRGTAGSEFATFTNATNLDRFTNDRQPGLQAVGNSVTKTILWGTAVSVKVVYLASYSGGFPPSDSAVEKYSNSNYYPISSDMGISEIADDLYDNYSNKLTATAVYAGAFASDATTFDEYVTKLTWDNGAQTWMLKDHNGTGSKLNDRTIVIYYSEPAYLYIENNEDKELEISSIVIGNGENAREVINNTNTAGYGMVFAKNGAIRSQLLPVSSDDLKLAPNSTISILIPGGCGQKYALTGKFNGTAFVDNVRLRYSKDDGTLDEDTINKDLAITGFSLDNKTLRTKSGETYKIIFGDDKPICKIVVGTDELPFTSISAAVKYISDNKTALGNGEEYPIQMLTDYLIPASDYVDIPAGLKITITTATDGEHRYHPVDPDEPRVTISRDKDNKNSIISVTKGSTNAAPITTLTITNIIIDGKNISGNSNGGAVNAINCSSVTIDNCEFRNVYAKDGGSIYIGIDGNYKGGNVEDTILTVNNSKFIKSNSEKSTASRMGGGAIHTTTRRLTLTGCYFDQCEAYDQGGAVFHRIDKDLVSYTTITDCHFTNCLAKAAGGVESDAKYVTITGSEFTNCTATERNGGGVNIFALYSANPTAECWVTVTECTFTNCRATMLYDKDNHYGGGLRSTAKYTTVNGCTFTDTLGKYGGAIAFSSSNAAEAYVNGCSINGSMSSKNGGGIYSAALETVITDRYVDGEGNTVIKTAEIKNCSTETDGGGIYYDRNADNSSLTITNVTIDGNSAPSGTGGGIYTNAGTTTLNNGTSVMNNTANGNGGGINVYNKNNSNNRKLIVNNSTISGNTSGGMGGGIYSNAHLTLQNGSMVENNRLSGGAITNAAGVYLENNRTFTIGNDDKTTDNTSIKNNYSASGSKSNLRLWESGANNHSSSVSVLSSLNGEIGVVNAKSVGAQFGSAVDKDFSGLSDQNYTFKSDTSTLHGIIDRNDLDGKKIIWAGPPICKITDERGFLLYFDPECTDPAIFDRLDVGDANAVSKISAFSLLRNENPGLYNDQGLYTGPTYRVEMLVEEYKPTKYITTKDTAARTIIFTTASASPKDPKDDYAYRGSSGTYAKILRSTDYKEIVKQEERRYL